MKITTWNYECADRLEVSGGGTLYAHRIIPSPPSYPGWRASVTFCDPDDDGSVFDIEAQGPKLIECLRSALSMLEGMDEHYREDWQRMLAHHVTCSRCGAWRDALSLHPHSDGKGGKCDHTGSETTTSGPVTITAPAQPAAPEDTESEEPTQ